MASCLPSLSPRKNGLKPVVFQCNQLILRYAKRGSLADARKVFDGMAERDVMSWNVMVAGYARGGYGKETFDLLQRMQQECVMFNEITFTGILNAFASWQALTLIKLSHACIVDSGMECNGGVGSVLVNVYCKCGSVEGARWVFDKLHRRTVVTWNSMIRGYIGHGYVNESLHLFHQMKREHVKPDKITFSSILNACKNSEALALGKSIHSHIIETGFLSDVLVGNALVNMYSKCGCMEDARSMFDEMRKRDVVSWTVLIVGYARLGNSKQAFKLFQQMQHEGLEPNKITFISVLNACVSPDDLGVGRLVHAHIVGSEFESDVVVATAFASMYCRCGNIDDANKIFDKTPKRDVVSWNVMISGYAAHGHVEEAFRIFQHMLREGMKPDRITFLNVLNAFTSPETLVRGKLVHACIVDGRMSIDVTVGTALVSMYVRCRHVEDARRLFDRMPQRNIISWNVMISGYASHGYGEEAFRLFHQLQKEGLKPDKVTFISIFTACSCQEAIGLGKLAHAFAAGNGFESDVCLGNALIGMYGRCGTIKDAWRVFLMMPERNAVSWTVMIAGYCQHGHSREALQLFQHMQKEGVKPDKVAFISILEACTDHSDLAQGRLIHSGIVASGTELDVVVGTAIVSMYSRCESLEDAHRFFQKMPERSVVSWNAMISGYSQHGQSKDALQLFYQMQQEGVNPDKVTFISILDACAGLSSRGQGKLCHTYVVESGMDCDVDVGNALVNMYSKCGSIQDACWVFNQMPVWDVISWNSMIAGYAQHGYGKHAVQLFQQMLLEGLIPNEITLISVLFACSHAGFVDEGICYFNTMSQEFGITPLMQHYNCMVDLLGRAGQLLRAENFIHKMPFQPNTVTWMTLLGSCRVHGFIDQAKSTAEHVIQLDPEFAPAFVVLSNIYAKAGIWEDAEKVRKLMLARAVRKEPGCSWIEVNNRVHEFVVGDISHPQAEEIYSQLKRLEEQLQNNNCVPDKKVALDVVEEEKEHPPSHHSERLAIALGLISTPYGTPLHIIKNLRVCVDCHMDIRRISMIVGREIIIRDSNRFHHFKDGVCSCGDYW